MPLPIDFAAASGRSFFATLQRQADAFFWNNVALAWQVNPAPVNRWVPLPEGLGMYAGSYGAAVDGLESAGAVTVFVHDGDAAGTPVVLVGHTYLIGGSEAVPVVFTQTAAQIAAAVEGSTITSRRGDTLTAALTGLGSLVGRTKLYVTVKRHKDAVDADALLQLEETAGLLVLNGAPHATPADGSVTVDDEAAGNITIRLAAAVTALLGRRGRYRYDVQLLSAAGVRTRTEAEWVVDDDVTRAID